MVRQYPLLCMLAMLRRTIGRSKCLANMTDYAEKTDGLDCNLVQCSVHCRVCCLELDLVLKLIRRELSMLLRSNNALNFWICCGCKNYYSDLDCADAITILNWIVCSLNFSWFSSDNRTTTASSHNISNLQQRLFAYSILFSAFC